ncbi:MAG TPA: CDP-diacylglycerol--glycerol-3-phosphate 3-phosphatidyltransferase [Haliangiales bacterium]|nr:CDP-diacylglycerol--glycerol-3-phosphate 3-phosphatidyltransferase [Haliangiales bacterium]
MAGQDWSATGMTTANKITIVRILLVPLFIVEVLNYVEQGKEWHRYLAIAAFLAASVCDGVDGYIARRFNQRSELGAILDPLADKLLLVAGIVLLSLHHEQYLPHLPLWLTATVISRDVLLLLGLVVIHYACGKVTVKPHVIGKVATVLQMIAVCWALLKLPTGWLYWIVLGATACTGGSGVIYVLDGVRQLSASPASSPAPKQ